jgi:hypothetical protein
MLQQISRLSREYSETYDPEENDRIKRVNDEIDMLASLISWLTGIVIYVINKILSKVIEWLTNKERNQTMTSHSLSMSIKIMLVKSIDATLLPFALLYYPTDWYADLGLIKDAFSILVTMTILDVLLKMFDVVYLLKKAYYYIYLKWWVKNIDKLS